MWAGLQACARVKTYFQVLDSADSPGRPPPQQWAAGAPGGSVQMLVQGRSAGLGEGPTSCSSLGCPVLADLRPLHMVRAWV